MLKTKKHDKRAAGPLNVVRLSDSVDLEHSPSVRKILLDAVSGGRPVAVDLAGVTYIDSSGIACLVEALQSARVRGGDLVLVSANPQTMRVLELARLDMVFAIHADMTSALAAQG